MFLCDVPMTGRERKEPMTLKKLLVITCLDLSSVMTIRWSGVPVEWRSREVSSVSNLSRILGFCPASSS